LLIGILVHSFILFLGYAIFGLSFFKRIDFAVLCVLFLCSSLAQVSMGCFLSLFFEKTQVAAIFIYILVIGVAIAVVFFGKFETGEVYWWWHLSPMLCFSTALLALGSSFVRLPDLSSHPASALLWSMVLQSLLLLAISIYADYVVPRESVAVTQKPGFVSRYLWKRFKLLSARVAGVSSPSRRLMAQRELSACACEAFSSRVELNPLPPSYLQKFALLSANMGDSRHGSKRGSKHESKWASSQPSGRDLALMTQEIDEDVARERSRIASFSPEQVRAYPLVVSNLQKYYTSSRFLAVRDVSFYVKPSTCFALLGVNGAGKTTTVSMIASLTRPTAGEAYVNGYSVQDERNERAVRSQISLCHQHDIFLPTLTVSQHLQIVCRLRGVRRRQEREVIRELCGFVCLTEVMGKAVGRLSGGQRRRLSLLISLIG